MDKDKKYEKIAFTALGVAYARTFSDIPFSDEIFGQLKKISGSDVEGSKTISTINIVPMFEARYKLDNIYIKKNDTTQILEIASGFSPRGLEFASNANIQYVEVDLPEIISVKKEICENIIKLPNLHFEEGDALDAKSLEKALAHFDPNKFVAILNEGLMRYLSMDQKAQYAKNIKAILERFGGVWITCDITLKLGVANEKRIVDNLEMIKERSGIDIEKNNTFDDVSHAVDFFENLGFSVEKHSLLEILDDLVCPPKVDLSEEETKEIIKDWVVFVMRLKK